MNLDDFKSTWQADPFLMEEKEMTELHKMIHKNTSTILGRMGKRYQHVVTSSLVGAVAFLIFFYTISDGFREAPLGVVMGMILMLMVTGLAWRRYQQTMGQHHAATLKNRLQELVAQSKRNLFEEQALVIGLPLIFLILARVLNGRGFSGLGQPEVIVGLIITIIFIIGLLVVIRRSYQRDIAELESLLNNLVSE